jgi:hypothetical protein
MSVPQHGLRSVVLLSKNRKEFGFVKTRAVFYSLSFVFVLSLSFARKDFVVAVDFLFLLLFLFVDIVNPVGYS